MPSIQQGKCCKPVKRNRGEFKVVSAKVQLGCPLQVKEQSIQKLADLYAAKEDAPALKTLLVELRPLFDVIPKAKTAKIVRTIIEAIAKVPNSTLLQVRICGNLRIEYHARSVCAAAGLPSWSQD